MKKRYGATDESIKLYRLWLFSGKTFDLLEAVKQNEKGNDIYFCIKTK